MKKIAIAINLLIIWVLCTGCPFESAVPIDAPTLPINPNLLGKWTSDPEAQSLLEIAKTDPFTYRITEVETSMDSTTRRKYYLGHLSVVEGVQFVNLQMIEQDKPRTDSLTYMIFKLEIKHKDKFVLSPMTEYIREKFKTSAEFKAFVKKHLRLSFFYEADMVYERH